MRLDLYLAESGMVASRTRAANLILLGRVLVDGKPAKKASMDVDITNSIVITEDYEASLGGAKLKEAIEFFGVDCKDRICADIGASNGGFTDILLKNGACKVYAVDVGECAFDEKLRNDGRVVVMDRTNARYLEKERFIPQPDIAVIDVSFISLKLILPSVVGVMRDGGTVIALIKPQFESAKKDLSKRGILTDSKKRSAILSDIENFCRSNGWSVKGIIEAPHPFQNKNQEYLICFRL